MSQKNGASWLSITLMVLAVMAFTKHLSTADIPGIGDGYLDLGRDDHQADNQSPTTQPNQSPISTDEKPSKPDQVVPVLPTPEPAPITTTRQWQAPPDKLWVRQDRDDCLAPGEFPSSNQELALSSLMDLVGQTPLGRLLLADLADFSVVVCFETPDQPLDSGGLYKPLYRAALIDKSMNTLRRTQVLVHELRHAWQHKHGYLAGGLGLQDELTSTFLIEADANAFAMAVMWQLHQPRGVQAWHKAKETILDPTLADAFEREIRIGISDPTLAIANLRQAMRAAFIAWLKVEGDLEYYVNHVASYVQSGPTLGVRSLDRALPPLTMIGRFPGQHPQDPGTYVQPVDIERVKQVSHERIADLRKLVHGGRLIAVSF
ncbi:MAG: DUF6782 family putative metallopeptidase [Pseudomonadota bacterium]